MAAGATYNAAGQILGWQENGSSPLTRTYDPARGWLTGITEIGGSGLNFGYAYNANGQVTSVTDSVSPGQAVTSYTYDSLNRLAGAATANWTMSWAYDEFGNRTGQTGTGTAAANTVNLAYDHATNRITTFGYQYDSNGNTTTMPGPGATPQYLDYDAFDRLWQRSDNSHTMQNQYAYDAFGRRIAKYAADGSVQVYFYSMSGQHLGEFDTMPSIYGSLGYYTTNWTKSYHYFAGQRVGTWTDRIGSKRKDSSNANSHYYPYGEEITGTSNDTYKFAQTYRDGDSGLDYANARYYATSVGRFLTPDPAGMLSARSDSPQSFNRYAYTEGDPVSYSDPGGMYVASNPYQFCWPTPYGGEAGGYYTNCFYSTQFASFNADLPSGPPPQSLRTIAKGLQKKVDSACVGVTPSAKAPRMKGIASPAWFALRHLGGG